MREAGNERDQQKMKCTQEFHIMQILFFLKEKKNPTGA